MVKKDIQKTDTESLSSGTADMRGYLVIKADKITYFYGETPALSDASIEIERGKYIAILGANGSGKSTLAKHFNALLLPTSGSIIVNGYNTSDTNNTWKIRQNVGMVFQNPENQIIGATVEDDIIFGMENIGINQTEMQSRLDNVIALLNLHAIRTKEPHQLSGGQKQRVAIAGILAMQPSVIIFDEATSMLDPKGRQEVLTTIQDLVNSKQTTIIHITHDIDEAINADYIYIMADGAIKLHGKPAEIFNYQNDLEQYQLQLPFSMQFYRNLQSIIKDKSETTTSNKIVSEDNEKSDKVLINKIVADVVPMNIDELVEAICKYNSKT